MELENGKEKVRVWFVPLLSVLALLLGVAHFWRMGHTGEAAVCLAWIPACFLRRAWMRPVSFLLFALLAAEWFLTTKMLAGMRLAAGMLWVRLVVILLSVAAVSGAAALSLLTRAGKAWFCRGSGDDAAQAAAFLLAAAPLLCMARFVPQLMLVDRIAPGFGALQALAAGFWSAWVCAHLMNRARAGRVRMFVWRLFSAVFFVQFTLALAGWSLFAVSGEMHIPVPGVIVAGALYRGTPGFMPMLFLICVLLAGSAWCSHLCYFGSWDAWAASASRPAPHPGALRFRALSLGLVAAFTLVLLYFAPLSAAVAGGAALGLAMLPVSVFVSRRKGYGAYCTMICPLGLLACLAGRFSPWRIRRTSSCTGCGACVRVCRYGAFTRERLEAGTPGLSCTLCRDCLNVCAHHGLAVSWLGMGGNGGAERAFVALVSALHALFLFSAMA